jgi:hypothetical protein
VDEMRRPKPSYTAWKQLTALAKIESQWIGDPVTAFSATVTPNSERELPSYPLHDYQLVWTVQDEAGITLASGARHLGESGKPERIMGRVPRGYAGPSLLLRISLLRPSGTVAAEHTLAWPAVRPVSPPQTSAHE